MSRPDEDNSMTPIRNALRRAEGLEDPQDAQFGVRAVARGFIRPEVLEGCLEEQQRRQDAGGASVAMQDLLQEKGHLTAEQCRLIHEETRSEKPGPPLRSIGKYLVRRQIGRGGMGTVFLAEDPELKRPVALKILTGEQMGPELVSRLHREAAIAARLQHPNIVAIHDVGMTADGEGREIHFIAMDFVEGRTLAHRIDERESEGLDASLRILNEVARAVAYAHSRGVVHRDIKPANILLDQSGRPLLSDFGLARAENFVTRLTVSGQMLGTPQYMAPEQVEGRTSEIDVRTDVYALGVVLYEILTGQVPFRGQTPAALFDQILRQDPIRPSLLRPEVDADLDWICLRALEKERARRYPSAEEFAEDLSRYRRGEGIRARPPSWWYRLGKHLRRRRPVFATAAAAALVCVLALLALSVRFSGLQKGDRTRAAIEKARVEDEARVSERLRWLEEDRLKPFTALLQETQALHYVKNADVASRLGAVERELADLEELRKDPDFARSADLLILLGMGWFLVGDEDRAERILQRAEDTGVEDGRLNYYLGRIYLHRILEASLVERFDGRVVWTGTRERWSELVSRYFSRPSLKALGSEEVHRHASMGFLAFAEQDYVALLRICKEGLIQFDPTPGAEDYWYLMGVSNYLDARIRCLTESIDRKPHHAWAYFARGLGFAREDDSWKASEDYSQAIRLRPRFWQAYLGRGSVWQRRGNLEEAIADYSEAIRWNPNAALAYHDRGLARCQLGYSRAGAGRHQEAKAEWAAAVTDADEAIRLRPQVAAFYCSRGDIRSARGEYPLAIVDFTRSIELDPKNARYYAGRGVARGKLEDWTGMVEDSQRALSIGLVDAELRNKVEENVVSGLHARGNAHVKKGYQWTASGRRREAAAEHEAAIRDFTEGIRLRPHDPELYYHRGEARNRQGYYFWAVGDFTRAIQLAPIHGLAYADRGVARLKLRDWNGAIEDLEEALGFGPAITKSRREMESDLAEAYEKRAGARGSDGSRLAASGQDLKAALEWGAAIADYSAAIRLRPLQARYYHNRGDIRNRRDEFLSAILDCTRALELRPRYALAYLGRGQARLNLKDWNGGIGDLEQALAIGLPDPKMRKWAEARIRAVRDWLKKR